MKEIVIYEYQLDEIINALRLCGNVLNTQTKTSCLDRVVEKAKKFAQNAKDGKINERYRH